MAAALYHALIGPQLHAQGLADSVRRETQNAALPDGQEAWIAKAIDGALLSVDEEALTRHELYRKLERVEAGLAATGFLVGANASIADIAFFSRIEMYPLLGMPITANRFPRIYNWLNRLAAQPAFAGHPTEFRLPVR